MKVVIEIVNGCVGHVFSDTTCEVVIIERDGSADNLLPDGATGWVSMWKAQRKASAVNNAFQFAESAVNSGGTADG